MEIGCGTWLFLFFICLAGGWKSTILVFTLGPLIGWIVGTLISDYNDKKAIELVNKREREYNNRPKVSNEEMIEGIGRMKKNTMEDETLSPVEKRKRLDFLEKMESKYRLEIYKAKKSSKQ